MTVFGLWPDFAIAAVLIVFCGFKLIRYGDVIATRFKLGHAFVGAVLIGWSTSLPELVLSIGTAGYANAPDISIGNVLGSNLFNILIIVLLDICYLKGAILRAVTSSINTSASLSLIMVLLVGGALVVHSPAEIPVLSMGYDAAIIFGVYMLCMFVLYRTSHDEVNTAKLKDDNVPNWLLPKCIIIVLLIVVAGLWVSDLSPQIAKEYNLEKGFVGAFFLAVISSLPEVITCFVALRMGFHNMALGTLFGSNIFNMAIIAACDIFYRDGNIFQAVYDKTSLNNLSSVIFIALMTLMTMLVLKFQKQGKKGGFIGLESVFIVLFYLAALYLTYAPEMLTKIGFPQ